MVRFAAVRMLAAVGFAFACSANAALPTVDLTFTNPSGTVGPTDSVEVWATMSIGPNGIPLAFDNILPNFGLNPADFPTQGQYWDPVAGANVTANFVSYDELSLNTWFLCSGTFTSSCLSGPPYDFNFHNASEPGKPSINFLTSFDLQPGNSYDYLFGVFTPSAVPVPAGTYTFERTGVQFEFRGLDVDGHVLNASMGLGATCTGGDPACYFTRTVTAVPEPATGSFMSIGLLLLGGAVSRLKRGDSHRAAD